MTYGMKNMIVGYFSALTFQRKYWRYLFSDYSIGLLYVFVQIIVNIIADDDISR